MIEKRSQLTPIVFFSLVIIWIYLVVSHLLSIGYFSATLEGGLMDNFLGDYRGDSLLKGDVVSFDYLSRFPKFGTIEVKFNTYNQISNDTLEFRIKEADSSDWFYRRNYKANQFIHNKSFPFGFPVKSDSKGKMYHIEIESLNGATESGVAIKSPLFKSVVIGKHIFSVDQLSHDPKLFLYFFYHKVINIINNPEHFFHLFLYSLPLIFFIVFSLVGESVGIFSFVVLSSIVLDIFCIDEYYSFFIISVMVAWLLNIGKHKVSTRVSLIIAISLLIISVPINLLGVRIVPDKIMAWSYLILVFSMTQTLIETKTRPSFRLSPLHFWKKVSMELKNVIKFTHLCLIGEVTLVANRIDTVNGGNNRYHMVAMVVYRFGDQMIKTQIITTKVLSLVIVSAITIQRQVLAYGPYFALAWVIYSLVRRIDHMTDFFNDFFLANQPTLFWSNVGIYLFILFSFTVIIFYFMQKRKRERVKIYLAIILLLVMGNLSNRIFSWRTSFRNSLLVWQVNPSDTSEAWADITIIGRNFKEMPLWGKVIINGVEQRIVKWSDRLIIFRTDPSTTQSGPLIVKTFTGKESDSVSFTYTGNQ